MAYLAFVTANTNTDLNYVGRQFKTFILQYSIQIILLSSVENFQTGLALLICVHNNSCKAWPRYSLMAQVLKGFKM